MRCDPGGLTGPTRGEAQGPRWRRTSHGFYVPAGVDGDLPEQRIVEQAVRLPAGGAVTGWAACRLWGAAFFDGLGRDGRTAVPVPLVTDRRRIRTDQHVRVLLDPIAPDEVVIRQGVPCAVVLRGLFDAMRDRLDVRDAVVDLDMAAAAGLVSISRLTAYARRRPGVRGGGRVRAALRLASELSRSPHETRTRLVWILDAGLPPPQVNQPVFDPDGRLLGIADLLDQEAGLVVEYDGADHRSAARHSRDVAREDRLRRHGLEVVRVTGPDLAEPARVVDRVLAARRRARWEPSGSRRWTTVAPDPWEPGLSLDDELEIAQVMRDIHLAQERADTSRPLV